MVSAFVALGGNPDKSGGLAARPTPLLDAEPAQILIFGKLLNVLCCFVC